MFHVVNAYTRAAQFEGLSAAESGRNSVGDGEVEENNPFRKYGYLPSEGTTFKHPL